MNFNWGTVRRHGTVDFCRTEGKIRLGHAIKWFNKNIKYLLHKYGRWKRLVCVEIGVHISVLAMRTFEEVSQMRAIAHTIFDIQFTKKNLFRTCKCTLFLFNRCTYIYYQRTHCNSFNCQTLSCRRINYCLLV